MSTYYDLCEQIDDLISILELHHGMEEGKFSVVGLQRGKKETLSLIRTQLRDIVDKISSTEPPSPVEIYSIPRSVGNSTPLPWGDPNCVMVGVWDKDTVRFANTAAEKLRMLDEKDATIYVGWPYIHSQHLFLVEDRERVRTILRGGRVSSFSPTPPPLTPLIPSWWSGRI